MKSKLSSLRRSRSFKDESGFTLIEMVVAIPVAVLLLGLVLTSAGITASLMGQINASAGAARAATAVSDELSTARNCAEISSIIVKQTTVNADSKYKMKFAPYTCSKGTSFPLTIDVQEKDGEKIYFTKKLTLAAM